MANHKPGWNVNSSNNQRKNGSLGIGIAILVVIVGMTAVAHAQSYSVIYNFTGGQDGAYPSAGLTIDNGGNIYGTALAGGTAGFGAVFSLDNEGSGWIVHPLYNFSGGLDGEGPVGRISIGPDGALYGTTSAGGGGPCISENGYRGCGTVYKLRPPARAPASVIVNWSSNVIYRFSGSNGAYPQGDLLFDDAGNIYGTAINGGSAGYGLIYKLTGSGGSWTQSMLYQAQGSSGGQYPWGGVVSDASGNLYGVYSAAGPGGYGGVYKLTRSGSGWTESTIHGFTYHGNDGAAPQGSVIFDRSGNLYGTTVHSVNGGGTVFELSPAGGGWSYDFIYAFNTGIDLGPYDKLVMDASGNLYGTTFADGEHGHGSVFKLTRSGSGWTYSSLHDFTGGSDGANPMCSLAFDASGNIYGTASAGGTHNKGVIFQITP